MRKLGTALFALLIGASVVYAEEEERPSIFSARGHFRVRAHYDSNLKLEKEKVSFFQTRFRIKPEISPTEGMKIMMQIDILDDVIWGAKAAKGELVQLSDFPSVYGRTPGEVICPTYANGFNILECRETGILRLISLKKAWAEADILFLGRLFLGRMPSNFGMGILENDGEGEPELGDTHFGDTRDRIMFATKPLGIDSPFMFAFGFDKIAENYLEEQPDVHQWFIAPYWKDEAKGIEAGVFGAVRYNMGDERTEIYIADLFSEVKKWRNFNFAVEKVIFGGRTKALSKILQAQGLPPSLDIFAINTAGKVMYRYDPWGFQIDIGYASGERGGLKDGKLNSIPFDPDFNVGLLMFEEVVARQTASLANNLQSDFIATRGGVQNALYVMPTFRFAPLPTLKSFISILWARAIDAPALVDPTGTIPGNSRSEKATPGRNYGLEVDWGMKIAGDFFGIGVELGYFMPNVFGDTAFRPKPENAFKLLVKLDCKF